jgi:hypothetical protein
MRIIINIGIISKTTISYVNDAAAILNDIKVQENRFSQTRLEP